MRIIIDGFGWRLVDLELVKPLRKPAPEQPGCDPCSTVAAQVEQASEPSPGSGFRGSTSTVVCAADGTLCSPPAGRERGESP